MIASLSLQRSTALGQVNTSPLLRRSTLCDWTYLGLAGFTDYVSLEPQVFNIPITQSLRKTNGRLNEIADAKHSTL
ncbi:hypothetical protein RRG08_053834 [Elysia crispata]|uniref:Uncharacterized protein n=1 Tax=Elysia crispata TaxID=231223 RepID=A0AAE1DVA1_9GAST|nr:hypothetical protein RRG08_053834 [Elysia crispata]